MRSASALSSCFLKMPVSTTSRMMPSTLFMIQYRPMAAGMTKPIQRLMSGIMSSMVLLVLCCWAFMLPMVGFIFWLI